MRNFHGIVCSILLAGAIAASGCSHIPRPDPGSPPEELLRYGWRLLDDGRTFHAKELFQELIYSAPGSAIIDSVYYGLAECQFKEKNYYLALNDYRNIVTSYPRSTLVDDAAFKIGLCYWKQSSGFKLDQTETHQAIESFRIFLLDYPTSELVDEVVTYRDLAYNKLARKMIYEGETYLKLGTERDLQAALIAFREVLDFYGDASHIDLAIWGLGETLYKLGRYEEAVQVFGALVANHPDSKRTKKARVRLKNLGPLAAGSPPPP